MKIKNEKGEEIEVFTAEETAERIKDAETKAAEAAVNQYKEQNPDKADEVDKLKNDLADAQKRLDEAEKGDNKGQVERLRKERDEALSKVDTVVKDITKKIDDLTNAQIKETEEEFLNRLSGGNVEMKKKIKLEFDNYKPNEKSKDAIKQRMLVAAQIVTGAKPKPDMMDNISGGGERGNGNGGGSSKVELTQNQKAIGNVLGITDKDRENYEKLKANGGKI